MTTHPLDQALAKASKPLDVSPDPFHRKLGDLGKQICTAIALCGNERRIDYLVEVIRMCREWWEEPQCKWGEHKVGEFNDEIRNAYHQLISVLSPNETSIHEWACTLVEAFGRIGGYAPDEDELQSYGADHRVMDPIVWLATLATAWLQVILDREHTR